MAVNPYDLSETDVVAQLGIQQTQPLQGLEGIGALGELPKEEIEQMPMYEPITGQQTIPLYQLQSFTPEQTINLQDVYGTSAMPIFEWVRKIQVGEKLYDPSSPTDQSILEQYQALVDENGVPAGLPSPMEITAKDIALATIGASSGPIASTLVAGATDPFLVGSDKITGTAKQFLPFTDDLPGQIVGGEMAKGYDLVKAGAFGPNDVFVPELASKTAAEASGNLNLFNELASSRRNVNGQLVYDSAALENAGVIRFDAVSKDGGFVINESAKNPGKFAPTSQALSGTSKAPTYWDGVTDRFTGSQAGTTWGQAGTMAAIDFGVRVLSGQKPVEAAKSAGAAGVAYAAAFALSGGNPWIASIVSTVAGPTVQKVGSKVVKETKGVLDSVGDVLGDIGSPVKKAGQAVSSGLGKVADSVSDVAKVVTGGRVICNELRRQGLLETKDVLLDYKFTKEHLTPQHVAGYHFWAVKVVKRLRKGKGVKFWKHIAGHRANEIAYIYGERDKPDYLGKLYRKFFEPVCWGIGLFCKETDWSVLYEDKEIC